MAGASAKKQTQQSKDKAAQKKGSQRILIHALVDSNSYCSFYVPEWLVALNPEGFQPLTTIPDNATPWVAKKSTRTPTTTDESLPTPGGTGGTTTTGNRQARPQAPGGFADENSSTKFIGRPCKLFFKSDVSQARGDKKYKHRTFRVHQAMSSLAVMYFLQNTVKSKITAFSLGKTSYLIDAVDITAENLGSLRDNAGATTQPGTAVANS